MMKTKLTQLLRSSSRRSLCARLAMLIALVICGVNSAWGDSYTCGFESSEGWSTEKISWTNYTTVGTGWGVIGDGSSPLLKGYLVSDGSRTGSQSLAARNQNAFYVVTPRLAKGTISFYAKNNGGATIKVFKASFNGETYSKQEEAITSWTDLTSSFVEKSFTLDEDSYVAIFLKNAIIDDFSASNGLAAEGTPKPTSFSTSDITFQSATLSWTAGDEETDWQLYVTDDGKSDPNDHSEDYIDVTTTPSKTISALDENTTYYAYVRANPDGGTPSDWVSCEFTTYRQYPIPEDFTVTSFTGTTATFNWTNGAGTPATAWQLQYATDENFLSIEETKNITDKPYKLTSLTDGTTYYARLRADYGDSHYSDWSNTDTFVPTDIINVTVNDGTDTYGYAPIYGNYTTSLTRTQMIIPADDLTSIKNRQITKLTFYSSQESRSWGTATFQVFVKEISSDSFGTTTLESWGTNVFNTATLSVSNHEMCIVFDVPFNYTDGNLMIGFKQIATGTYQAPYWYGVAGSSNQVLYGYGDNSNNRYLCGIKTTITSVPVTSAYVKIGATGYTTFASKWKLDLNNLPAGLTAYYAATDAVDGSVVHMTEATGITAENEGLLLKGTAGTVYAIPTSNSSATFSETNLLKGVGPLETALAVNETSGYNNYVLVNNSGTAEFQSLADHGATIPGGKAYLRNGSYSGARALSIVFDDDETTGITDVRSKKEDVRGEYYDLQGRKVAQPTKGLYIVNGRKVVK